MTWQRVADMIRGAAVANALLCWVFILLKVGGVVAGSWWWVAGPFVVPLAVMAAAGWVWVAWKAAGNARAARQGGGTA